MLYFGISFSASSLSSPSAFSSVLASSVFVSSVSVVSFVSFEESLFSSSALSLALGSNQRTLSSSASNLSSSFRKLSGYSSSFSFLTVTPVITLPVRFFSFTEKTPSVSSSGFSPIVFKSSFSSSALSASSATSLSSDSVESLSASSEVSVFAVVSAAIAAWLNTRLLPSAAIINAVTTFFFIVFKSFLVILYSSCLPYC